MDNQSRFYEDFQDLFTKEIQNCYYIEPNQEDIDLGNNLEEPSVSLSQALIEDIKIILEKITNAQGIERNIKYSKIAEFIYQLNDLTLSSGFFDRLNSHFEHILTQNNREDNGNIENESLIIFDKMIKQAELSSVQKNILYDNLNNNLQRKTNDLESKLFQSEVKFKELEERAKKLEEKSYSVYTDFIAILGVFSSFVFVMFAGFDSLAKILENLGSVVISIPQTIFIASILISFIITIVYFLLLYIAKIIGKTIIDKGCDCTPCNNIKHRFGRHRFYLYIISVTGVAMIICFFLILFDH